MSSAEPPPGVAPDRAWIERLDDTAAVLRVGPGGTRVELPPDDLPPEAAEGAWVVLDLQLEPPLVLGLADDGPG